MIFPWWFIAGILVGAPIGLLVRGLCWAAADPSDDDAPQSPSGLRKAGHNPPPGPDFKRPDPPAPFRPGIQRGFSVEELNYDSERDNAAPSAPKSQTSPILSDIGYRVKLIQHGVHPEYVNTEVGHRLDYIGNLVGCYRTSMEEQDPSRYAIEKFAAQRRKAK